MKRSIVHLLALCAAILLTAMSRAADAPAATDAPETNEAAATTNALAFTNAPDYGQITSSNLTQPLRTNSATNQINYQAQLDRAHEKRLQNDYAAASKILVEILNGQPPTDFRRRALFELALNTQDDGQLVKAQQIFAQYLHLYTDDPSAPEVLLRQGLLFRRMNVNTLALSKFYSVMSTTLKLKLDSTEYYKRLVLQAQTEIADTYYLDGKFDSAIDFYIRILKADSPDLNTEQIEYKLVRSLGELTNYSETASHAQIFIGHYSNTVDLAEVRFIYASALKEMGRNEDSMRQVLALLQSEQDNVKKDPELWAYWQRRAGNVIANQLYKEGDYLDALEIYLNLAPLDQSLAWQAPVLYQSGLIYEHLEQWQKAGDTYANIIGRTNELTETNGTPMLRSLFEMAQWRKDYITWLEKARASNNVYHLSVMPTIPKSTGTQ